jgi:hypothetical protein
MVSDRPCWVSRRLFYKYFDQTDFLNRDCLEVEPLYLSDWFKPKSIGYEFLFFELPTVQFVGGKTQFINGRHRAAVLIKYLDDLPLALAMPLDRQQDFPPEVIRRQIRSAEVFEIPELPIVANTNGF